MRSMHPSTARSTRMQSIIRIGIAGAAALTLAACSSGGAAPSGSEGAEGEAPAINAPAAPSASRASRPRPTRTRS